MKKYGGYFPGLQQCFFTRGHEVISILKQNMFLIVNLVLQ